MPTLAQIATKLNVSANTLRRHMGVNNSPPYTIEQRHGKMVKIYNESEFCEWWDKQ